MTSYSSYEHFFMHRLKQGCWGCWGRHTLTIDLIPYQHIPSGLILWGLIKDWQLDINRNEHYSQDINRLVGTLTFYLLIGIDVFGALCHKLLDFLKAQILLLWCNFQPIISIDALCILSLSTYTINFS